MICPNCQYQFQLNPRSKNQNSYLWGVVYKELAMHLGYTIDEIHELMKHKFLSRMLHLNENEEYNIPLSTTDLSTSEFEDYLRNIREWASSELNCFIPEPNEPPLMDAT